MATTTPGFYQLEFAAQMIVWATRKRLHMFASGTNDAHVAEVFELAKLDGLYAALMTIMDVLACGASNKIQLHGVACPCLPPHEVALVNGLAHLQAGQTDLAYRCIAGFMGAPAARLVWPAMGAIVNDLDARALRLACIAPPPEPERSWEARALTTLH
jgi:hypothetical protein